MVLENGRFSKACHKSSFGGCEVKLHPKRFDNTTHWLNNIRDWNISRQLWWGQQIGLFLRRWQRGFCGC
jgi:valyl-tRNA synthetase